MLEGPTKQIESLRAALLFDEDAPAFGPMSEQHYLLALSALDTAVRHMTLAGYYLARKD